MFAALAVLISLPFWLMILATEESAGGPPRLYILGLMWAPGLAALSTASMKRISIASLGWEWRDRRLLAIGYFLPLLYTLTAYLLIWGSGLGGFYDSGFVLQVETGYGWETLPAWANFGIFVLTQSTFGVLMTMTFALGEEIGWRGFLVPRLMQRFSFGATCLISGAMWAVWHYPLVFLGGYGGDGPVFYSAACFTALVIALSVVMAWLRLRSASIWPAVILHASHNLYIQSVFEPLTEKTELSRYFVGEFGLVIPALVVLPAAYLLKQRASLSRRQDDRSARENAR
ncbi:MAG: CPBP family intramembrane metalloprotease [Proteobacteria bacterium]|nr:CPBP family intramembrane metalloprotease [Pseudomonadota bacterium]